MGLKARMLGVGVVAVVAMLVGAGVAGAYPSVVRVESKTATSIASAFVNRVAVDVASPVTVTDGTDPLAPTPDTTTCAAESPLAAVLGASTAAAPVRVYKDAGTGKWRIAGIKGLTEPAVVPPATQPAWYWRLYVDQSPIDNGLASAAYQDACTTTVPIGSEVLLYQACGSKTTGCFTGTPLYARIRDGGPYDVAPQTVPGAKAPVVVRTIADKAPAGATVSTDEGASSVALDTGPLFGQTSVPFTEYGPHTIMVAKGDGSRPPVRMNVCVSEGNDGYCGSTKVQSPADIPYVTPSPCETNGHDGLCGTTDTSGPITHVTNIVNKKAYKAKKGPGQVKGTIDVDPNGVQDVRLRLTRTVTVKTKVKVKTKKKTKKPKYKTKTVKRCSTWNDSTLLLETTKKCGTASGKYFNTDLSDLRNEFAYSFAMALPRGSYVLEIVARDENGFKDAPVNGRNVLKFTVA